MSRSIERLSEYAEPLGDELVTAIISIKSICDNRPGTLDGLLAATEHILRLRHTLVDSKRPREAKDAFRTLQGFDALLGLIRLLADFYDPSSQPREDRKVLLTLFKDVMIVLAESLREQPGNRRFFAKKIEGGGPAYIEKSLMALVGKSNDGEPGCRDSELIYGGILAAALSQETVSEIFSTLSSKYCSDWGNNDAPATSKIRAGLRQLMGAEKTIELQEFLGPWLRVWLAQSSENVAEYPILRLAIPACLCELASHSRKNIVALHSTGMLASILPIIISGGRTDQEQSLYQELAEKLLIEGVNSLEDAVKLYRQAYDSPAISRLLLHAVRASRGPPCIYFDMASYGYSSVELPDLGRPFPPMSSGGYTLSVWVQFDRFDPDSHTTIFGAFDSSQTCFLLAYLEKQTRNFILQTSIKGPRPSVRFKSVAFEPGRWYHICVVHRRARANMSSRASLFVNGEFVEQTRIEYPSAPMSHAPNRTPRVQAFLGTPKDLASKLGRGVSSLRWSLASAVLFEDTFSDDLIAVFYHLGPRYQGNFQDCLGSFQTYKASAALNLRNESLHPGKEEQSDIVTAVRQKAGLLVRESSILLNISPTRVLDDDDKNYIDESQLINSLSKHAARNLRQLIQHEGKTIVLNGAVPGINDALTRSHGIATLVGAPVVSVPQALDDASWRIGGCTAVHLSMLQAASTPESTVLAVEILFESVQDNWRNSEAMERENGYGILAMLLREKLGYPLGTQNQSSSARTSAVCSSERERSALAIDLLRTILGFIGYDFENPDKSIITNPLAYRVLLVDLDIWRYGEPSLYQMYYSQFIAFAAESRYRKFNTKRLSRMRVNKKLLDALRGEEFCEEAINLFIPAFRSLFESCASAELLRSLALFITYALHEHQDPKLKKKRSVRFRPLSRQSSSLSELAMQPGLPKPKVGLAMLRMYADYLCTPREYTNIKRFARAVTNKWLLYLLCEDEAEAVVLATKILARLIVAHGSSYSKVFAEKSGGFTIMCRRLKRWWTIPAIWLSCFAILFGIDIAEIDVDAVGYFGLPDFLSSARYRKVAFPEVLPVLMELLRCGVSEVIAGEVSTNDRATLTVALKIFRLMYLESADFREFACTSDYTHRLLLVLYPVIGSGIVSAEIELRSLEAGLNFDAQAVAGRQTPTIQPLLRTTTVDPSDATEPEGTLHRTSSFVLISSDKHQYVPSSATLHRAVVPQISRDETAEDDPQIRDVLHLVLSVFSDQLLERKDFSGLGLFLKSPPGYLEYRTHFESWLLRHTLQSLQSTLSSRNTLLQETRTLTNLSRFMTHIGEAIYEGWFIDGAGPTLDFAGSLLEYLCRPDISSLKMVRLCNQVINNIRSALFRVILHKLSEVDEGENLAFLHRLSYWQAIVLETEELEPDYLKLFYYLLYTKLVSENDDVRQAAATLWRIVLVQKPSETASILSQAPTSLQQRLSGGFEELVGMDDSAFLRWVDDQREDLDAFFFGTIAKLWDAFVQEENRKIEESSRSRLEKRKERLRQWMHEDAAAEEIIGKQSSTYEQHWTANIYTSEILKHQRVLQDQHDNHSFLWSAYTRLTQDLRRFGGLLAENTEKKWRLDQTEGRSRMRLRVVPDDSGERQDYQPKRKASEPPVVKADSQTRPASRNTVVGAATGSQSLVEEPVEIDNKGAESEDKAAGFEDSFELIEDPKLDLDGYEDKNRKVMRSLQRGDQVQSVCNMSRIIGLEACEGLLILGKEYVYILDNYFQRADGEIVNVWQAPPEERDQFVQMIAGRESSERKSREHETRSWKWSDLISVSKRRFLFRDVALEVFFSDGSSYLITLISSQARDELYGQLLAHAPHVNGNMSLSRPEDVWRFETLRIQDDAPQSLGSRFASVFGQSSLTPATRKWVKGEMSNFHYLMLINTLAGRSFNDLTQYPVFPWVLADYTSEELDLTNPRTFRDLSKPMGCQTPEREVEFRERYKSFAEMGDENSPAFHYGTHYSSAMIVSWYLIRLQPFVKSYLMLQGGTFDHADRLFYSVGKAWESASRGNMSDVRELIPEFFYLPEFLVNSNNYDFGTRQNMSRSIDAVELPPWAKGDPKIFIAKHREALESPYVTENLHQWIDLVFGFKQKGEAAVEAVNVFHHLSYQGAKDLDKIEDPVERLATIGIIHNFGQTPHQVFTRPHPRHEGAHRREGRLDTLAESLTRVPLSSLGIHERVSSLSMKQDRLLCAAPFRLNIPPTYDKYLEWGFLDGSVRFYSSDSKKILGHFEQLHIGQLSCALFADSRTLVTAGTDCTVSIWSFQASAKSVELQPQASLFGHRRPVSVLAVTRSFSTLLSASLDGQIMLWDLNKQRFLRELPADGLVQCARINDMTGNIMICRGNRITLYSLNGALLVDHVIRETNDDQILSCAFYEGVSNEWMERELLFTGHRRGLVNVWAKVIRNGRMELELIRQLHHMDPTRDTGAAGLSGITCILPLPQTVYTGDESGRVYQWDCVQRRS